ncbi:MAG TPA: hypothetical protein PLH57_08970 [Oligoflexia bacterium]|nr:hypothetical protein [Oligoflexia bacterium]
MDREAKLDLMRRALGIKHKLKVHDSMPRAETHEQVAATELARGELEEELAAIDELLFEARAEAIAEKKKEILKSGVKVKKLESSKED